MGNNKKRIIFDASVLVSGHVSGDIHKTGLYRVSYEILTNLCAKNLHEYLLYDVFSRERELKKYVQKDFPGCSRLNVYSFWYRTMFFPIGDFIDKLRLREQIGKKGGTNIPAWLIKNILIIVEKVAKKIDKNFFHKRNIRKELDNCDIYYSTYFPVPSQIRLHKKIKRIYTLHDMIPILHPEYFSSPYNQSLVKEVVDNIEPDDYVICVSESTKKDLINYRPELKNDHITVSLLAASDNFYKVNDEEKIEDVRDKYNIPSEKKYLLSVCTLEPRKNLRLLFEAFRELLLACKTTDLVLVLTGSPGWGSDIMIAEISELNEQFNNSVILTGFIPDNELAALYSGSYIFVYPSFYEGFGLPPLEAMKCGVPVISSNTSSLPEVVGNCGIFVDPTSKTDLVNAIMLLLGNIELRNTLAKKSLLRASDFSWEKTTEMITNIFTYKGLNGKCT